MRRGRVCVAGVVSLAVLMVSASIAPIAYGHGKATGVVKERMELMVVLRDAAKALGGMMKGAVPYDAAQVKAQAEILRSHSGAALTKLFPEGTGGMPSEAREEIWENWDEFTQMSNQLELLASGLMDAADNGLMKDMGGHMAGHMSMNDPAAIAAMPADGVFMMIAQACSACHEKFRQKM
ncbi:c-type cytochrome [Roseibium suaedae]|uniref:Cytochrome c556 n=1 Tax=Roseibium suaedae TaxID=735517 RepID=A0A1M7P1W9_9HYPH|nr:cytochrome c [Roseibium suaedae]SHN09965.1 Cytochrome c556 [Roseibium suaedae]